LSIATDITERRQAEEELRRRETLLQRIFEVLPVGLWLADRDGTLLRGNPAAIRIWGAEPRVPITEYGIFKAWRLPSREPVLPDEWALARTIREGVTVLDELLEIEAFDGVRRTILNYTAPVLDEQGATEGAIVINLDVSDRVAMEERFAQAQKMEAVGRLAGGVAHDFNNMLSVILGYTELALDRVDPTDQLHADLEEVYRAASHSAEITRQLLAFARRQTINPIVLDLNTTVESMLKMLRRLIGEDIDLVWHPGAGLWPVHMDPSQVDQILANLCVNARDAISGVGRITIEACNVSLTSDDLRESAGCVPGDYVQLSVSDDGCGMDAETLRQVFEPFFTTKGVGAGTGLGLATVYGIVKQNAGFINAYSEPGKGSTFRIYLPRHAGEGVAPMAGGAAELPHGRGETVLIVEDEAAILKLTTTMLWRLGYEVLGASSPEEALALAGAHSGGIHLLVSDVVMPGMDGRKLADRLLAQHAGLKVLFMSGYTANVIAHRGVLDEGVAFVQKPFAIRDFAIAVRSTLDA
jgi:signal transduction histidine kinase/CheY-like chemotaxis protein